MKKTLLMLIAVSLVFAFSCSKSKKCSGGSLDGKVCSDVYASLCSGVTSTTYENSFESACTSSGGTVK